MIALPLQRKARDIGNTLFVDEDFQPIRDQWGLLAKARVVSANDVTTILSKNILKDLTFSSEDFDLKVTEKALDSITKRLKYEEFIGSVDIRLGEQVFINFEGIPDFLVGSLSKNRS